MAKLRRWKSRVFCFIFFAFFLASNQTMAAAKHETIRRLAVFPFSVDRSLNESSENAWWHLRKRLTDNDRFLVASRSFMIQRDVHQARGELSPADVIILGKILDAHGLVTTFEKDGSLHMVAYDGRNADILWRRSLSYNRNRPTADQLLPLAERLANDFIASVPYQGYQIEDYKYNEILFEENGEIFTRVQVTPDYRGEVGDSVEWVELPARSQGAVFDSSIKVIAKGRVESIESKSVIVRLANTVSRKVFRRGAPVRIPRYAKKLYERYGIDKNRNLSPDIYLTELSEKKIDEDEASLTTALTFIANLAAFIVIAF